MCISFSHCKKRSFFASKTKNCCFDKSLNLKFRQKEKSSYFSSHIQAYFLHPSLYNIFYDEKQSKIFETKVLGAAFKLIPPGGRFTTHSIILVLIGFYEEKLQKKRKECLLNFVICTHVFQKHTLFVRILKRNFKLKDK